MVSVLGCFRGSYRWHAAEGFHGNKGDLAPRERLRDRKISQECVTANEMRVGPSKPACRRRLQTTSSCCGTMAVVVSVEETAGRDSVRYGPRR